MWWGGTFLPSTAVSTRTSVISGASSASLGMAQSASREFAEPAIFMLRRRNRRPGEKTISDHFPVVLAPASWRGSAPHGYRRPCGVRKQIPHPAGTARSTAVLGDRRNFLLPHQPLSDEAGRKVGRSGGEHPPRAPPNGRRSDVETTPG